MPLADLPGLNVDIDSMFANELDIGSYRIQIATEPTFGHPVFDRAYEYPPDVDVRNEFARVVPDPGIFWVRLASIDLLGEQQPFSKPRRYRHIGAR